MEGEADNGTGPVNGYVATRTTSGMKTDVPITEIPQSMSVIGRDEIDDRRALKVDEALRYTAGVVSAPYGGRTRTPTGSTAAASTPPRAGVFLDNLSLYSYGFGGFQVDPLHA